MTQVKNTFSLDHDHHFSEDRPPTEHLDPAEQSLADALRWAFFLLKLAMIGVLVAYCFTGIFRVQERERAVRLRFGRIVGESARQVYEPGWHLGWPYPIEQKIHVPIDPRTINLNKAFWYEVTDSGDAAQPRGGPLNPEKDGSLLTADANIVHGRFTITYKIVDPAAYVRNVGDLALAERIVTNAAEQGLVYALAQVGADDFVKGQVDEAVAKGKGRMQRVLDRMDCGINVDIVSLTEPTVPLAVRAAYKLVIDAENEKVGLIEEARQKRTMVLNETAGEAHQPLFELVQGYELARAAGDARQAGLLAEELDEAFDRGRLRSDRGGAAVGGKAAQLISAAQTERTQVVEKIKSEANAFRALLDQYQNAPRVLKSNLWQNAREVIFGGDVEIFFVQGPVIVETNPDPSLARQREQDRLKQRQERIIQDADQ